MAAKFAIDAQVRQILPAPIQGTIVRFILDETNGDIHYVIVDKNGHESVFKENDLEAI